MIINRQLKLLFFAFAVLASFASSVTDADILNWQTGETIAGTEGVIPGPERILSFRNTDDQNLRFADFEGLDLSTTTFRQSWLDNA